MGLRSRVLDSRQSRYTTLTSEYYENPSRQLPFGRPPGATSEGRLPFDHSEGPFFRANQTEGPFSRAFSSRRWGGTRVPASAASSVATTKIAKYIYRKVRD